MPNDTAPLSALPAAAAVTAPPSGPPDGVEAHEAEERSASDRAFHAMLGRFTGGLSPTAMATAWLDWAMHLAGSPAKQQELQSKAMAGAARLPQMAADCLRPDPDRDCPELRADSRFRDPAWQSYPYNFIARSFLQAEDWWDTATSGLPGVDRRHGRMVNFAARQWLDTMAPSNFALTNPVVVSRTREERGANLVRGARNWGEDFVRVARGTRRDTGPYRVGETLALTPGEVVWRNRLIELIRYRPVTDEVKAQPVLVVPAWIMKYYILDLSPENSLVRHLLSQGFEVYMISWRNPGAEDAALGMDDYVRLGVLEALDVIGRAVPGEKVHATGYCLGGTLLSIAAATLAREGADRLQTLTLLAAQVDFSEAGEITLFINPSQVAFLEDIMAQQGYLRADQMAGAFQMLRSNDLIWSRVVRHYLLGERTEINDLMAWNADTTRMPARMHSEYLRWLFLENRLALGQYEVEGRPVSLEDITVPLFAVGTEKDHVSPWRSAWKITRLTDGPVTFLLINGGHNAGIISEPGHPRRHYRMSDVATHTMTPDDWVSAHAPVEGSWWPAWTDWLARHSTGVRPAELGPETTLGPAPGTYVFG
ncbi:alpha/beta fold hydrolase [Aquicoccus sp. SCR17]|nr:alpha/beta fold hydrolase [Carideicomes alvinocaridis]